MKARAETVLRDRLELGPVLGLQPRRLAVLVASVSLSFFLALTVWTFSMALEAYQRRSDAAMIELALALARVRGATCGCSCSGRTRGAAWHGTRDTAAAARCTCGTAASHGGQWRWARR